MASISRSMVEASGGIYNLDWCVTPRLTVIQATLPNVSFISG